MRVGGLSGDVGLRLARRNGCGESLANVARGKLSDEAILLRSYCVPFFFLPFLLLGRTLKVEARFFSGILSLVDGDFVGRCIGGREG